MLYQLSYFRIGIIILSICQNLAFFLFGGASWIRTSDTRIFSPLLYQLSYGTFSIQLSALLMMQI
ncbi:hypothetical protein SPHINGO8BC_70153 [Sphingobacterium multivorum]|uniref:Uncharacterized protein n=1 Tax=Sphingobacterium multivorum TaxID=28454 RepID=A0A654DQV6_SPHMU|nr:hypothetical protein SPHINGO8BC_70153 [Sphingobacterium multivorum]